MGTENEGAGEANAAGAPDPKKDGLYEDRPTSKKIIRVVTVVAYMVSVSFVAIVLSAYYVFLWQPPNPRLLHRDHLTADPQIEYLVDKPPTEVIMNESLSPAEIRNKVNVFREEILRTRGVNISIQTQLETLERNKNNSKVRQVDHGMTNGTGHNNSEMQMNTIARALLGTREAPTTQITLGHSTDVYESLNNAMKRSTVADSLQGSTVFMEAKEINGSDSTTRLSSSSSLPSSSASSTTSLASSTSSPSSSSSFPSLSSSSSSPSSTSLSSSSSPSSSSSLSSSFSPPSSFSSLPESEGELYNATVNDIVSTTAIAFATGDLRKFGSVTGPSINGITPTRAYELLESLGSTKAALGYTGSSGVDQNIDDTKIGMSGIVEKNAEDNVGSLGGSEPPRIWQSLKKSITTSGRRREDLPEALEFSTQSNIIGSHITRLSTQPPTNNPEPHEKLSTNFRAEKEVPMEIIPGPTEELEPVLNSAASVVPAVVQPQPSFTGKKQQLKEQLTEDGDFAFI